MMKMRYTVSLKNGTTYHASEVEQVGTFLILHDIRECWHRELRIPAADIAEVYIPLVPEHVADLSNTILLNLVLSAVLVLLIVATIFAV
ncbi:MAG: hypothetical protein WAQ53_14945 [Thiofilum sp.]|uniref:hypothetical protein n=1 Tax=Thiofilum sp. TaxID=2212733 RepID=UPI0025F5A8A4|nr:hypothetical protein [Thiofilum sp.]MBK8451856.1 hypothetical protein [Thiofilum sp.]